MPVGGQAFPGLARDHPPLPCTLGYLLCTQGSAECLRTSACPFMTIVQMRKVRFRIGNYLAPDHLTSRRQICHLPAKSRPPRPQAGGGKGPPGKGSSGRGRK